MAVSRSRSCFLSAFRLRKSAKAATASFFGEIPYEVPSCVSVALGSKVEGSVMRASSARLANIIVAGGGRMVSSQQCAPPL